MFCICWHFSFDQDKRTPVVSSLWISQFCGASSSAIFLSDWWNLLAENYLAMCSFFIVTIMWKRCWRLDSSTVLMNHDIPVICQPHLVVWAPGFNSQIFHEQMGLSFTAGKEFVELCLSWEMSHAAGWWQVSPSQTLTRGFQAFTRCLKPLSKDDISKRWNMHLVAGKKGYTWQGQAGQGS